MLPARQTPQNAVHAVPRVMPPRRTDEQDVRPGHRPSAGAGLGRGTGHAGAADGGLNIDRPVEVRVALALADSGAPVALSSYLDRQGFQFQLDLAYSQHGDGSLRSTRATLTATREGVVSRRQLEALVARVADLSAPLPAPPQWTVRQVQTYPGGITTRTLQIGAPR